MPRRGGWLALGLAVAYGGKISAKDQSILSPQDSTADSSRDPLYNIADFPSLLEYEYKRAIDQVKPAKSAEVTLNIAEVESASLPLGPSYGEKQPSEKPPADYQFPRPPSSSTVKSRGSGQPGAFMETETGAETKAQTGTQTQALASEGDSGEDAAASGSYVEQLYAKLEKLFGTENQLLTLEWPGRILDEDTFKFDWTDQYSNFLKPAPVQDAEFRLTNDLFPLAQKTGGPSNFQLSNVYRMATSLLVESTEYPPEAFLYQKKKARAFLAKVAPGLTKTVLEAHEDYLKQYQNVSNFWDRRLDRLKQDARTTPVGDNNRDALVDQIVMENEQAQNEQNIAWKNLVVNGMHHEVMSALAVLDIDSPGEMLQEAKDRLRNSGRNTLDGAERIYPVSFQPEKWHELLTTSFTAVDFLMEPSDALAKVKVLQDQRISLQDELSQLVTVTPNQAIQKAQEKIQTLQVTYDSLRSQLEQRVGLNDARMMEMYCTPHGKCLNLNETHYKFPELFEDLPWDAVENALGLPKLVLDTVAAHNKLLEGMRDFSTMQMNNDISTSDEMDDRVKELRDKVKAVSEEIQSISITYSSVVANSELTYKKKDYSSDSDFFPSMPKPGPWSRIVMKGQTYNKNEKSGISEAVSSSSSQTVKPNALAVAVGMCWWSWNGGQWRINPDCVNGCMTVEVRNLDKYECPTRVDRYNWLSRDTFHDVFSVSIISGNSGPEKLKVCQSTPHLWWWTGVWPFGLGFQCQTKETATSSSSTTKTTTNTYEQQLKQSQFAIGFEVAKVTIGRGWFKPEFLEHTDLYMTTTDKKISKGRPNATEWHSAAKLAEYRDCLMPSYPVAFVLARDITIRISNSELNLKEKKESKDSFTSGSTAGFSSSSAYSGSTKIRSGETSVGYYEDAVVIKIAGAQILMWIQNYIGQDRSSKLAPRNGTVQVGFDVLDDMPTKPPPKADNLSQANY